MGRNGESPSKVLKFLILLVEIMVVALGVNQGGDTLIKREDIG